MFNPVLTSVFVIVATTSAITVRAADRKPARDYSSQLSQTADAVLGQSIAEDGAHFYQGRDRQGQACLVTVQYNKTSVDVEIKKLGAREVHEEELNVSVPGKSSSVTGIEVNSNGRGLGVAIEEEVTPYGSTRVDHYAYRLNAQLNSETDGIGRLASVLVSRDEKGKTASADCGSLSPVLALTQRQVDVMAEDARDEYLRRNPGDQVGPLQGSDVDSCVLNSATSITCDVGFATDYTPDTLHVQMAIKNGALGAIQALDYEPGC